MSIIDYKKFIQGLSESLDTSNIKIRWIDKVNRLIGLFDVGNNTYQLDFNLTGDVWSYKFYLAKKVDSTIILSPDATGIETDKYKVLSMSKSGILYIIENKKPNAIIFSAINETESKRIKIGEQELTKRQHIYLMLVEQIPELFPDYTYDIENIEGNQIYIVYKKELDNQSYTNSNIQKVISNYITNFN